MGYNKSVAKDSALTAELKKAGYNLKAAAQEMGVGYQHLVNVARGRTHASQPVIDGFERLTGKPISEFVSGWVLVAPFRHHPGSQTKP
ncbi:helix-turn-helix domain-containing protein [Pseudonocardia lutea]|uniref:Helix-turn-helix domain-containing protein n=1 Tax=Pseudonocardia lutea TaxID=2172015 RepID=A0ABW1I3Z5_9PSEU